MVISEDELVERLADAISSADGEDVARMASEFLGTNLTYLGDGNYEEELED